MPIEPEVNKNQTYFVLSKGRMVSHYRILEKIGSGGMGVIYKAEDTKLRRTVALKFLTPHMLGTEEEKARFVREAQAGAALDHPNICTVYEIDEAEGQTFIAMAYLEGQSLRQKIESGSVGANGRSPLPIDEALDIAIQVVEGLQEAHERGIVHRDIKSANIVVATKGQVKIMDFGLAKLAGRTKITQTGTILGTVAYISLEQARGETVDHRTDIWSLGVVLYEMITGQLPFKGEYEQAVVYSILNEEPEPIMGLRTAVPMELERIVNKALAKNPGERYQHMDEMRVDLRALKREVETGTWREPTSKPQPSPSIAVLPFANLTADPEQEYFCDGMAEEIINALTHVEGLHVVARTSAFLFKDRKEDIREIGRKLNVGTLLEGSVRKAGNRLRISAQLINVANRYHLWSERYDRELTDVFAIQDEISLAVVEGLKVKLLRREKVAIVKRHTQDLDAYNLYLKGRYHWNKRYEEGLRKGLEYFQQAIAKDPDYALAYIGIADCYNVLGAHGYLPPNETYPKAKTATFKALEIDDTLAETHASLGICNLYYDWDWPAAKGRFKRAIELNPGYATAHHWYAIYLSSMGRVEEAIAEMKRAQRLDPLSLIINAATGWMFYLARQYKQAIEECRKALELDPDFTSALWTIGQAYEQQGKYEEAIAMFEKAGTGRTLAHCYAVAGKRDRALKVLNELEELSKQGYVDPYDTALIYSGLGESDQAFEWLEKAYKEHDSRLLKLKVEPALDSLRSDPRFAALLKKMGLDN